MANYALALIEKPLDEGLSRHEIVKLLDLIGNVDMIPVEFQAEGSTAMGFITLHHAEIIDYDYDNIKDHIEKILNDTEKENPDHKYFIPFNGLFLRIWLSRN